MALEDRIRPSVDAALSELSARVDAEVRAVVQQLITAALDEQTEAVAAARQAALEEAAVARQTALEEATVAAERQVSAAVADAETRAERVLAETVGAARAREREAEMATLTRLVESVRSLDAATSLSEVLDALGAAAGREAARAAVLVARNERLVGWKLCGFGVPDTQPKSVDLGLAESGVMGLAVSSSRPVTTRDALAGSTAPGFAQVPADRMGFAVPVIVGGRVVAVAYADSVTHDNREHAVPSAWPEVIEILARHAARCLEALTIQKAASASSPRFWVAAPARQAPAAVEPLSPTSGGSEAPPGVIA